MERCAGIDVGKKFIAVCVMTGPANGEARSETRIFGTTVAELKQARSWITEEQCTHVMLESTGSYWKPIFNILEGHVKVTLANPQEVKARKGHKTDQKDAWWLAHLLRHGMVTPSFIPPRPQRELRDLTRRRRKLIQTASAEKNRISKVLEDANIKLTSVVTDIMGMTGHAIVTALVKGEVDPERLAHLARGSLIKKQDQLKAALAGKLTPHHRVLLEELLQLIATLNRAIARFDGEIAERLRPHDALISRIDEVTGLSRRSIEVLLGELGWDMSHFPDAAHAASWVGICPGNHETGGKHLSGRIRQGNRWAKTVLVQAAHAAGHTQSYLGEQYRRISARRGAKRAAVAVGHSILVILYHMVKTGESYHEKGADYFTTVKKEEIQQRLVRQLERLGNTVILQPKAETTLV